MLRATARTRIWGEFSCWSTAPFPGSNQEGKECSVALEIQGSPEAGYHLVKAPEGFFEADDWFESETEALEAAFNQFGVHRSEWSGNNIEPS